MKTIETNRGNEAVVRFLCRRSGGSISVVRPDEVREPYLRCGSHPDVVARVWEQLGRGLLPESRRIVCGTPVLVHPVTGLILAIAYGTSYALRLPLASLGTAFQAGYSAKHRWGNGTVTDLSLEFGRDWVFGSWSAIEETWCQALVAADAQS